MTHQSNLYAAQYPPHSRFRKWKDVSLAEVKQFMSLYPLTGIIRKPELNQFWNTNLC